MMRGSDTSLYLRRSGTADRRLRVLRRPDAGTQRLQMPPEMRTREAEQSPGKNRSNSWPIVLFIIALVTPWIFPIGPLRMSAYRIVLCIMLFPCLVQWMRGHSGRIRIADLSVILFGCWCGTSLIVLHGMQALQPAGIALLETLGPYLLARSYIRSADDFQSMVRLLFIVVVALLPLALVEALTGWKATLRIFGMLLPTYPETMMTPRAGLWRAQGPYEHPILFGTVCSTAFAFVFLVLGYRKTLLGKCSRAGIVAFTAALSLSAGPVLGIGLQCLFIVWRRVAEAVSPKLICFVIVSFFCMIQLASWVMHRSLIEALIVKLTFDPMSYWSRNLIWTYGWLSVADHPWFGTGLNRWERPDWMDSSIDNFWLYTSVKSGLPALFLMCSSVVCCVIAVGLKQGLNKRHREYRAAYLISVVNWCLVGLTVHLWDGAYVLIIFLLGSGIWLLDVDTAEAKSTDAIGRRRNGGPHRRRVSVAPG